jgi:hypothetical protein
LTQRVTEPAISLDYRSFDRKRRPHRRLLTQRYAPRYRTAVTRAITPADQDHFRRKWAKPLARNGPEIAWKPET